MAANKNVITQKPLKYFIEGKSLFLLTCKKSKEQKSFIIAIHQKRQIKLLVAIDYSYIKVDN